jgi:hypothetical protein
MKGMPYGPLLLLALFVRAEQGAPLFVDHFRFTIEFLDHNNNN